MLDDLFHRQVVSYDSAESYEEVPLLLLVDQGRLQMTMMKRMKTKARE